MKIRLFLLSAVLMFLLLPVRPAAAETATIITKENAIREQARFFSPVKAKLGYGDKVKVLSREGGWVRVQYWEITGYIHESALEKKSFSLGGLIATETPTTSRDEVALAGKGFNPQVEESFRNKHPNLDFATVNRIETFAMPDEALEKFIEDGGLRQP